MNNNIINNDLVENVNKPKLTKFLYKDKVGHNYWYAICPYCGEEFKAREDSINTGNTKSCGCLRRKNAMELGKANKKNNAIMYPLKCDFGICYYDNDDSYFIFDEDKKSIVESYHWTALKNDKTNRVEPITWINGKGIKLSRLLMNAPENLEVDHINHNAADLRVRNLRICTKEQNMYNRKQGQGKIIVVGGKYTISNFPKEDATSLFFDTEEEAYEKLCELQDKYYDEYSYRRSQEIANQIETNQFTKKYHYPNGILEEISNLPEKHYLKVMLTNIERDSLNGVISEENEGMLFLQLLAEYKKWKLENINE